MPRGLRLKTIRRSHKPEKKWDAVFERNGREKVVPFGAAGMSDYTKHKNDTAGALSRWILWNKPSFRESVADYKRRFGFN